MPIEPARAAARSLSMSACRFVATMVSREDGSNVILTVMASTSILLTVTSGYSLATWKATSSQRTRPDRCAFDCG
jgi:hypothetical protein